MLQSLRTTAFEFARSTRHNLLHLRRFRIGYAGDCWTAKHATGRLRLVSYPYLACHDMEGYLKNGAWSLEPGQTVIDAGGCHGEFAAYAAQCVGPAGRVIMLEPDPANVAVARRNFALNPAAANVTILQAGLWHSRGTIRFSTGHDAQSAVVTGDTPADLPNETGVVEIQTLTLADIVHDCGLDRLDFVKMDIEGAELEALSVAGDLPAALKPKYAIASYHDRDGTVTAIRCEQALAALGYRVSTGNPRHLTTWAEA